MYYLTHCHGIVLHSTFLHRTLIDTCFLLHLALPRHRARQYLLAQNFDPQIFFLLHFGNATSALIYCGVQVDVA